MLTAKDIALPKELKSAEWSKNKSIIAKMKGFTGVGDALKTLETNVAAVSASLEKANFPADAAVTAITTVENWLADVNNKVAVFMTKVAALQKAAADAGKVAKAAEVEFTASKVVPKATAAYAKSVAGAAASYEATVAKLTKNSVTAVAAAELPAVRKAVEAEQRGMLKEYWHVLSGAADKIQSAKSLDFGAGGDHATDWGAKVFQPSRALLALSTRLSSQDKQVGDYFANYTKLLHGADDSMQWVNVSAKPAVAAKVYKVASDMAADGKKLAAKFG